MSDHADSRRPSVTAPRCLEFALEGEMGRRLRAVTEQWILPAPHANPAMLEMFRYRDRLPYPRQVPWAGEFAGKYLTHAVLVLRLTGDTRLREQIQWFAATLAGLQDTDGYLGAWPKPWRLRTGAPNSKTPWDAWGHYHIMLGMILWHETSGDPGSLACACRIGDLFCDRFLGDGPERLHGTGAQEMNQAPVHALAMLHRITGEERYLAMALRIVEEFALPPAGDYLRAGLADIPFHQTPKPRWESLHPIQGLAELFRITGDERYRTAFSNLWRSMRDGDRHNTGGFTSGEMATGNPYDAGAIETCCTVAWSAMSVDMLDLSGDSRVADELEMALFNSGLGMMSPSGRWVTYNTPMSGEKCASAHSIVFQARAGMPELNCCSVNGPRILGMLSDWAVRPLQGGVAVNYYGPGRVTTRTPNGGIIHLIQTTDYPLTGGVVIEIGSDVEEEFPLFLRIPSWSESTRVRLNGQSLDRPAPGGYLRLARVWRNGDRIDLDLDLTPHIWRRPGFIEWETTWNIYGPIQRRPEDTQSKDAPLLAITPPISAIAIIPDSLLVNGESYERTTVESTGGVLDPLKSVMSQSEQPSLIGMTTLESPVATTQAIIFDADWWITWYVNGVQMAQGVQATTGYGSGACSLPLRAGSNLITFTLGCGTTHPGWLRLTTLRPHYGANVNLQIWDASVYRGPILLAYDPTFNTGDTVRPPQLLADRLELQSVAWSQWMKPWMLFRCATADGGEVFLCDFASAGLAGGHPYETWLPMDFCVDSTPSRRSPFDSQAKTYA